MLHKAILALVLLGSAAALADSQPYYRRPSPAAVEAVRGYWYLYGDPQKPCFIDADTFGRLFLTNERGEQSWGRLLPGSLIVAMDWNNSVGDVRLGVIEWRKGAVWSRLNRPPEP